MRGCTQILSDDVVKVIRVVSRVHDNVLGVCGPFDQPTRLWAIAPLARRDREPDQQAKRIDRGVYLGG